MAHLQYMPGDPHLVDQLVYELKSKGIFDQFRKDCIADVDTRPAYQNLRQRVESSVSVFLSRQTWKSDLNKNQLREKLRKHILDGNYLEQGVERIVDQVVNPKVAAVFKPQVEDLVYNYLGIPRKRTPKAETTEKTEELLPIDLEAVSPGSVKSNDDENNDLENKVQDMEIDSEEKPESTEEISVDGHKDEVLSDDLSLDKSSIPLPTGEINLENIPAPDNSPEPVKIELERIDLPIELEKPTNVELKNIELPKEPNLSTDIPLPDEMSVTSNDNIFKPIAIQSEDSNTSSGSSIRRNMSPLTPVRNFDDENSCDAQQAFENNSDENNREEPSTFQFNIETKVSNDSSDDKVDKKTEQLSYQFSNRVNINTYNTPMYDDSSNSHNLQIDYESDANTNNSKTTEVKQDVETGQDSKKERKDDKKDQKKSHRSRDSTRHSSSKHSSSRDSSRHDKKTSKDDKSKSSKDKETSKDGSDKKDSSKYRSSHKSSSSSKDKHRSSSHKHSSSKSTDERKSSSKDKSSEKDKEKSSDKSSKDRKDSKSSSHRDKDRKSSKKDDKDKKKDKKDVDDHYSSSGRGNHSRRSTDRDSNDGSSSSKGSQGQNNSKSTTDSKKESKSSSSKSDNTSTSGESTSQSDKEHMVTNKILQFKPIVRVDNHLETPIANPPRLPFVPDVTLKKPKFANNFEEAKKMMKMRKFLAEEQKRMNQEAALLLEFQANVRPSLSQVYSSISGPELEFACVTHPEPEIVPQNTLESDTAKKDIDFVVCDSNIPETIDCSIDEPLEMRLITKNTKDIINDIIGVPIEEYNEQRNNDIIETDIVKTPILLDIYETKNDSSEEIQPSQIVKDVIKHEKAFERCPDSLEESLAGIVHDDSTEFEIAVTTETLSETDVSEILEMKEDEFPEKELQYFAENEKYSAELERHKFSDFLSKYIESSNVSNKMYVINCDTYEENIIKEVAAKFGDYEIVNYYKNGHLVPNKNIVKDVALSAEVSLPLDSNDYDESSLLFSPAKSECSFDLSSDYDAKLDEIVNKKSRQEVMEIILGGIIDESNKMPTIDYYTELSDSENSLTIVENTLAEVEIESTDKTFKRIIEEAGNNNRSVLTPNKIRKMSESDQISSTTEEPEVSNNNKVQTTTRSKYLGRAKRVGLSKPKKCNLPNSPSSDKSVENYTLNTPTPNGKLKATPRSKVQRYATSDLYKPKLHYLSRRNNIS